MTKIINFCGGPGSGKSTMAAGLFYEMKQRNLSVEIVHEVAKKLTWQKHHNVLSCQPKVFGDQLWDIEHLIGQVSYIIVDSPLFLTGIYHKDKYGEYLNKLALDVFKSNFDNITFFVKRQKAYVPNGRNQTFEEAVKIDGEILQLLKENHIKYDTVFSNKAGIELVLHILGYVG